MKKIRLTTALAVVAALTVGTSVAVVNEARPAEAAAQSNTVAGENYSGSGFKLDGWLFNPNLRLRDGGTRTFRPGELVLSARVVGSVDRVEVYPGWTGQIARDGKKGATVTLTNQRAVVLSDKMVSDEAHRFDFLLAFAVYGDSPLASARTMAVNRAEVVTSGDILPTTVEAGPIGGATIIR